MPDPTAGQKYILQIAGYTADTKQFLEANPHIGAIETGHEHEPRTPIRKGDLPAFIVSQVLADIGKAFAHYDDDEIIFITAGQYEGLMEPNLTAPNEDRDKAIKLIKKILKTLEG